MKRLLVVLGIYVRLKLLAERRFRSGVVHLHYALRA